MLTGPAAKRTRSELECLLKYECHRVKIPGRCEYYSEIPVHRSGNKLLKVKVDDDAMERLRELDFQVRVGASGMVKFQDKREAKQVNKQTRANRLQECNNELEELRKKLVECEARKQGIEADTESVGSGGITGLRICLLYTSPSPRDRQKSRMPSSA